MNFVHAEEFSFSNYIPNVDSFNKYNSDISIDSEGKFENPTSKAYLEYKKESSKKFTLNEKFSFIHKKGLKNISGFQEETKADKIF